MTAKKPTPVAWGLSRTVYTVPNSLIFTVNRLA